MQKKTMTIAVREGGVVIVKPKPVENNRDTKKGKGRNNA